MYRVDAGSRLNEEISNSDVLKFVNFIETLYKDGRLNNSNLTIIYN